MRLHRRLLLLPALVLFPLCIYMLGVQFTSTIARPFLGTWQMIQACGPLPLSGEVTFQTDGRLQSQSNTLVEGTYQVLDHQQMQINVAGRSEILRIVSIETGFVLRNETEIYSFCRGANCLAGGCSSGRYIPSTSRLHTFAA